MVDTCVITRSGEGRGEWNSETNQYDPPEPTVIYEGRCKVQTRDIAVDEVDAGQREHGVLSWELHLPVVGSEAVARDDRVTITSSQFDAALLDQAFVVAGPHAGTAKTARRLPVEAVV